MRQFSVHVRETREGWSTVEAETAEEALAKAKRLEYASLDPVQSEIVDWHILEVKEES